MFNSHFCTSILWPQFTDRLLISCKCKYIHICEGGSRITISIKVVCDMASQNSKSKLPMHGTGQVSNPATLTQHLLVAAAWKHECKYINITTRWDNDPTAVTDRHVMVRHACDSETWQAKTASQNCLCMGLARFQTQPPSHSAHQLLQPRSMDMNMMQKQWPDGIMTPLQWLTGVWWWGMHETWDMWHGRPKPPMLGTSQFSNSATPHSSC